MRTLGERIAHIQKKTGARCLQEAADIPQSTLSRYIRNQSVPPVDRLVAMAKAGGVSAGWLAAGEEDCSLQPSPPISLLPIGDQSGRTTAFSQQWLSGLPGRTKHLKSYYLQSDAMEPTIRKESLTLVDTSQTDMQEGIFLVRISEELVVRRLQFSPDRTLQLLSDNRSYPPHLLPPEQASLITIVGRIVWYETRC